MKNLIVLFTLIIREWLKLSFTILVLYCSLISTVYSQPLQLGQSVVTSYSFGVNSYNVVRVIDIRNRPPFMPGGVQFSPNQYYGPNWTYARMRNVFGIAIEDKPSPNIFIASSTVFCTSTDANDTGLIYRIDGATWQVTNYVQRRLIAGPPQVGVNWMPNTGPRIGNLCFDDIHKQIFTTNHEDGRIYRITDNGFGLGIVSSSYDPFGADDMTPGYARRGERLWGIGIYGTVANGRRVYFSRWVSDRAFQLNGPNEIWSVALDNAGEFIPSTLRLEITLTAVQGEIFSSPVSDIEFSFQGTMLLGERTMVGDAGVCQVDGSWAHRSRILEYPRDVIGLYSNTNFIWHKIGQTFGTIIPYKSNSSGGVDFDYGISDSVSKVHSDCDSIIVGTGDYMFSPSAPVYGLQIFPRSSAGVTNIQDFSDYVDITGILGTQDKTSNGDVDVYRKDLCGDTSCMTILSDTVYCDSTGAYIYEFKIKNNSPTKYIEELEITVDSPQPPNYVVAVPSTISIFPPIPPLGASGIQRVKLIGPGAVATAEVCYTLSAHFVHDDCPWCCFIENCIKLPICGTCAEVIQDSIYCSNGNYFYNFTLQNGTIYDVSKIQLTSPGAPLTFVPQTFHFNTPIAPGQLFPNLTAQILGGAAGMSIPIRIKLFDSTFECCYFELKDTLPSCDPIGCDSAKICVKTVCPTDSFTICFANSSSPYNIIHCAVGYPDDLGCAYYKFPNAQPGVSYYIVVKTKNSIETWSATPQIINGSDCLEYDFTTDASQAYGNNMININGIWTLYSGDVNQDGVVDGSDLALIYNAASNFELGGVMDLNCDGIVDASDLAIAENNAINFVSVIKPEGPQP